MSKHWMLDLETLSTAHDAAVIQYALLEISKNDHTGAVHSLDINPAVYGGPGGVKSLVKGFSVSDSTIEFHHRQGPSNAIDYCTKYGVGSVEAIRRNLFDVLNAIGPDDVIWANGTDFDIPVFTNFIKQICANTAFADKLPWKYSNVRDLRTLLSLVPSVQQLAKKLKAKHHAVSDCERQIELLRVCYIQLNSLGVSGLFPELAKILDKAQGELNV